MTLIHRGQFGSSVFKLLKPNLVLSFFPALQPKSSHLTMSQGSASTVAVAVTASGLSQNFESLLSACKLGDEVRKWLVGMRFTEPWQLAYLADDFKEVKLEILPLAKNAGGGIQLIRLHV